MKSTVLTAALCLVIGIAIGWFAKPEQPPSTTKFDASTDALPTKTTAATPSTKIVDSPTIPSKAIRPRQDEDSEDPIATIGGPGSAMQERFGKMILEQAKTKTSAKVAELAEKLGLTEEQTAQLQAYFDGQIAEITADGGMPDMMALSKLQTSKGIDTALAGILTDDQSAAYEELKTNERNRKVESRAYKDLARVNSVLDLDDDQKNAVYDILYEQAAEKVDKSSDSGSAMAMVMNGHGIDIDVDDIGLGGIIESATSLDSNGDPSPMSQADIMKNMREQNQKRINDKVESLAPVLTPEQTEQYRKHLESRNSGMFQNMMIEGADANPDGPTGAFKIETRIVE